MARYDLGKRRVSVQPALDPLLHADRYPGTSATMFSSWNACVFGMIAEKAIAGASTEALAGLYRAE